MCEVQAEGWSEYQTAQEMETSRKYEYDPEFVPLICKWLCLASESASMVVDVGCGSGYFTKIMASCMKGKGKIIGIDPDRILIQEARKICKRKHVTNVQFKIGNVWKIPLESNYADLVTSHVVLSNIPRQFDAILEMKRVAKIGGRIAVIDPTRGLRGQFYPDERLDELASKFQTAFGTAIDKEWRSRFDVSTSIEDFHLKIARLFLEAGLTNLTMNGHLSTFLLCDARRSTKEMRAHLRVRLGLWRNLQKRNEKCASVGGMDNREFLEFSRRYTDYLKDLVTHPRMIKKMPEVHMVSRVIVCGIKSADER